MMIKKYGSVAWAIASAVAIGGTVALRAEAQEPTLTGPLWQLEEIVYNDDTTTVPEDPQDYSIQFFEDGSVGVRADCNVGNGVFDPDSTDFITLQAFTLAECGPDSIDDEFRQALDNAAIFFFQDGDLYMDLFADAGTMRFSAVEDETDEVVEEEEVEEEVVEEDVVEEDVVEEETVEPAPEESEPVPGLW